VYRNTYQVYRCNFYQSSLGLIQSAPWMPHRLSDHRLGLLAKHGADFCRNATGFEDWNGLGSAVR
jgi:hypothetical protein